MSIKFIETKDEKVKTLRFKDVNNHELFVNLSKELCLKSDMESYCRLTDENGTLCCRFFKNVSPEVAIRKIFNNIEKVEFEMIRFILKDPNEKTPLRFSHVEDYQFFIDDEGCLSQKVSSDSYIYLTDGDGNPNPGFYEDVGDVGDFEIQKILPVVSKIEF